MSGGTMSEQQVLPELDIPVQNHNPGVCDCDLVGGDEACTIQPPYLSGLERWRMALKQREEELRTALASLAQSEAERERLQGELRQSQKCLDEIPSALKLHGLYIRGTPNSIIQVSDAFKKLEALAAELARERGLQQGLRQVVKQYRVEHATGECCINHNGAPSRFRGEEDDRCDICKKADALLEPQPAPVATEGQ